MLRVHSKICVLSVDVTVLWCRHRVRGASLHIRKGYVFEPPRLHRVARVGKGLGEIDPRIRGNRFTTT